MYPEIGSTGVLHSEVSIQSQGTTGKMHRYLQQDGQVIWTGHLSSEPARCLSIQ